MKEPRKEESLLMLLCRWNNQQIKLSTKQRVITSTWDNQLQKCITSKEKFSVRENRQSKRLNFFLENLSKSIISFYENNDSSSLNIISAKEKLQLCIDSIIQSDKEKEEKLKMTPIAFFKDYIERKRIDTHTGRFIAERTKIHQRTVVHRLESFLNDTNLPNDFFTFTSKKFDAQYTEWCYETKNYKQNTVYATYAVLKSLLNAAKEEGFEFSDTYKGLKGKGVDVDNIYLTEDEISSIYHLDIKKLINDGEIDNKSTIEQTRDLFIISCWTGLRRSDINQLNKALFDIKNKTITITTEKTKRQVVIPMHPFIIELWHKYNGHFPKLGDKANTNEHLRECARHAGVDSEVRIVENRGGKVKTLAYKKYQLVGMHTGRRSLATNLYKRGFPTIAVMKLTNHTTESNFLRYIKVSPEEHAAMMASKFIEAMNPFSSKKKE